MARRWGHGTITDQLHHVSFELYETLAKELKCQSYRKLPTLGVIPYHPHHGTTNGIEQAQRHSVLTPLLPNWMDGNCGNIQLLAEARDTAQITPAEFVEKMRETVVTKDNVHIRTGHCKTLTRTTEHGEMQVTGVTYTDPSTGETQVLEADAVVTCAGPWSVQLEEWLKPELELSLPMEGIKSTSMVWTVNDSSKEQMTLDATAVFCEEDNEYHTHLEVFPRPDNTLYVCGVGGSDTISKEHLQQSAHLQTCDANQDRVTAASKSLHVLSTMLKKHGKCVKVQACMRPCPPDAVPYMGAIQGCKGLYINAGHNCWGIAWAPACGKVMSEVLLVGEAKCLSLKGFDPMRFCKEFQKKKDGDKDTEENVYNSEDYAPTFTSPEYC